jgi:hypothetical protein
LRQARRKPSSMAWSLIPTLASSLVLTVSSPATEIRAARIRSSTWTLVEVLVRDQPVSAAGRDWEAIKAMYR